MQTASSQCECPSPIVCLLIIDANVTLLVLGAATLRKAVAIPARRASFDAAHLSAEGTAGDSLGCKSQGIIPRRIFFAQYAIDRLRGRSRC